MRKTLLAAALALASLTLSLPSVADVLRLRADAPERYVVKKGDTLWDISAKFLKTPWRWPELWRMNKKEIKNPHWIYPGDVLYLATCDGKPCLKMIRDGGNKVSNKLHPSIRESNIEGEVIPPIPLSVIRPFLNRPLVISENELKTNPRVAAGPESRVMMAEGDKIYAIGLDKAGGQTGQHWQVYRPGKALIDPDLPAENGSKEKGKILGYEANYLADADVTNLQDVSTLVLVKSKQEVVIGDRLLGTQEEDWRSFLPHTPETDVHGKVISIAGGVVGGGQYSVVVINRGSEQGMERGHVLALYHKGRLIEKEDKLEPTRMTPSEQYGEVMLFRVFDKVSYGLIMHSTDVTYVLDEVRTP